MNGAVVGLGKGLDKVKDIYTSEEQVVKAKV